MAGVAIALNGTIAGASKTFREFEVANKFAAILLPSLFRPGGSEQLEVYAIIGEIRRPSLVPMKVSF
ncbi:MAG: hypothetical protein ACRDKW_04175 [Actinomycetota bacterium]